MCGAALIAVSALLGPSASAAQVSYWDEANRPQPRLEDLDADPDALTAPPAAPISRAETTLAFSHDAAQINQTGGAHGSADTETSATKSGNPQPARASLIIDTPQRDLLGPLPDAASTTMTWASDSNDSDIQTVAVPLPSGAWTGFTCLGGIAVYYLLRRARRAFH